MAKVFVVYPRGNAQRSRVYASRTRARRYVRRQLWPNTWVMHQRTIR